MQCAEIHTIKLPDEALTPSFIAFPGKKFLIFTIAEIGNRLAISVVLS